MRPALGSCLSSGVLALLIGCSSPPPVKSTGTAPTTLTVTAAAPQVPLGGSVRLTATVKRGDGTTADVTEEAVWSSENPARFSVSNDAGSRGVAVALSVGTGTVVATYTPSGAAAITSKPLSLAGIAAAPKALAVVPLTLAAGTRALAHADATLTDGTTLDVSSSVTWSVAPAGLATVSNTVGHWGEVTAGHQAGSGTLAATLGDLSAQGTLSVTAAVLTSIAVTASPASAPAGHSVQLTATGTFSDGSTQDLTTQVAWSSPGGGLAITPAGEATPLEEGLFSAVATFDGVSGQAEVAGLAPVIDSLASLSPAKVTLGVGQTASLKLTALYSDETQQDDTADAAVKWAAADPTLVGFGSQPGTVIGKAPGQTTVTATLADSTATTTVIVTAPASLTPVALVVSPQTSTLETGQCFLFTATVTYSDGSSGDASAIGGWTSSDTTVLAPGNAPSTFCGAGVGSATLTATLGDATGTAQVAVAQRPPPYQKKPTAIELGPTGATMVAGDCLGFSATIDYDDGSTSDGAGVVAFSSSDPTVLAYASGAGDDEFCAVAPGTANVVATLGSLQGQVSVTVTARAPPPPPPSQTLQGLVIGPDNVSVPEQGYYPLFFATCQWEDGHTTDCTQNAVWTSGDPSILDFGLLCGGHACGYGVHPGTTTLSATIGSATSNTLSVTVTSTLPPLEVTSLWPTIIDAGGGVALTGQGFSTTLTEDQVTDAGGHAVTVTSATSTGLSVAFPSDGVSGPLTVTVRGQTVTTTDAVVVRYPRSSIASFTFSPLPANAASDGTTDLRLDDGNLGSGWYLPYLDQSMFYYWRQSGEIDVDLDLGRTEPVGSVGFTIPDGSHCDGNVCSLTPTGATLAVSDDGTTYTTVGTASYSSWNQCNVRGLYVKSTTPGSQGRYVRLTIEANTPSGYGYTAALFEVAVSGT